MHVDSAASRHTDSQGGWFIDLRRLNTILVDGPFHGNRSCNYSLEFLFSASLQLKRTLEPRRRPKLLVTVDIFRIKDGDLVGHWDVQEDVPAAQTKSGRPISPIAR